MDEEIDLETGLIVHRYPACLFPTDACAPRRIHTQKEWLGKSERVVVICEKCSQPEATPMIFVLEEFPTPSTVASPTKVHLTDAAPAAALKTLCGRTITAPRSWDVGALEAAQANCATCLNARDGHARIHRLTH